MTLRKIFISIQDLFSNFFNAILDFDLFNILTPLFILAFLFGWPWLMYLFTKDMYFNFKKWSIFKKIGMIFCYIIMLWSYIAPITLYLWD